MKKFMFFKSDLFKAPKASFVYFVDILKTAAVIQEDYELFRNTVGFDFHPLEVVLEMKEKDSRFWNAIKEHHCAILWGLLFGYGKLNAWTFQWKYYCPKKTGCLFRNIALPFQQ